jgi:hypothetical protein
LQFVISNSTEINGETRMDNPEELATQGKDKQSKQYNTEN